MKGVEMTTKDQVIEKTETNTLWLNKFTLINPTDETLRGIGEQIVWLLQNDKNLLPKYVDLEGIDNDEELKSFENLSKLTPTLYLRINAS